ncbi:phosphotransferase [Amycolatopsis rubida]|uniref:Phosphotransferase enzyme family protein n=1 Tax=Amycolatopsis rubida TaxID=112413 RepID=A0A1I5XBF0_9PSEU|nr:phosphotransferase [Amycolatopsis rubida]SFQ29308.1 Phosphotransferase enzyme family protein [Amycolatopsis rubida]
MGKKRWEDLPPDVRRSVEKQLGEKIVRVLDCDGNADFSGIVHTEHNVVFVKAASQCAQSLTRPRAEEERRNRLLPSTAPRILWRNQNLDWVVTGYEYVPGRPVDLRPGSRDLRTLVRLLAELAVREVAGSSYFESMGARWSAESPWRTLATRKPHTLTDWDRQRIAEFTDMELHVFDVLSSGTSIAHGELSESSILIGDGGVPRIVGWTWALRAPAWVDAAVLAVRLVEAGHTPAEAESIVSGIPEWKNADAATLDAFSVALLGLRVADSPGSVLTCAARRYAQHRFIDKPAPTTGSRPS